MVTAHATEEQERSTDLEAQTARVMSMYAVISTPRAYNGQRLVLHGYLLLHGESGTLFVNETAMRHGFIIDGIYLRLTPAQVSAAKGLNGAWIFVEGRFSATRGDGLRYAGTLDAVTRMKKMDD